MIDTSKEIEALKKRIAELEAENYKLRSKNKFESSAVSVVKTPAAFKPIFDKAERLVSSYFDQLKIEPDKASVSINNERYVLMRASSLSIDFLNKIKNLYSDKGEAEAIRIGQNFLFDISHVIGLEDARAFHKKMDLKDPISKLSAGPVHFAFSGWASVEIIEANPVPNEDFYLKYSHPHSFEAESWISQGKIANQPVCTMNAGYSSGWCEESFGIPLTAIEITCRAKGDDKCTFIMAHPSKIKMHLERENLNFTDDANYEIPLFFERKNAEQEIIKSLEEKSILLKEIHHRVKNNLQLISSLLNLQSHHLHDQEMLNLFEETKNRIKAIALVHEKLYQSSDVEHVNLKEYIQSIIDLITDSFSLGGLVLLNVNSSVNNKITIDKALPCGLILNELVSNAVKYAFPNGMDNEASQILVTVTEDDQHYKIIVDDNGKGLPSDFSLEETSSLGFDIILSLVDQLNGTIRFDSFPGQGSSFTISFDN